MNTVADTLKHSAEWHEERRKGIGGSDAATIMDGNWHGLWLQKTGRESPADLSDILPVIMGIWTEPLNLYWLEKQTGQRVFTDNLHCVHPEHSFVRCNLDGWVIPTGIVQAKHVNAWAKEDEVVAKYFPQVQHEMLTTETSFGILSVFFGTLKWEYFEIAADPEYQAKLLAREIEFWGYVERNESPPDKPVEAVSIAFDEMREVSMEGNNAWAFASGTWLETKEKATFFKMSETHLKELVEPDVKRAWGHGVEVKRAKNGALRIRRMK